MTPDDVAVEVVRLLRERGQTVATAESLTGGLVCATLVAVPGASAVVRGGVVAYQPDVKRDALGVRAQTLAERGTVDPLTAQEMARGACDRLGADWAVATTGVAGPDPSEGQPVGTVHVAVAGPAGVAAQALRLDGDRDAVRRGTVRAALSLLRARLGEEPGAPRR